MSEAITCSRIPGHSSCFQPCSFMSGCTPKAMSESTGRSRSQAMPFFSMIALESRMSPSVWESSGERFSVQLRKSARRSEKSHCAGLAHLHLSLTQGHVVPPVVSARGPLLNSCGASLPGESGGRGENWGSLGPSWPRRLGGRASRVTVGDGEGSRASGTVAGSAGRCTPRRPRRWCCWCGPTTAAGSPISSPGIGSASLRSFAPSDADDDASLEAYLAREARVFQELTDHVERRVPTRRGRTLQPLLAREREPPQPLRPQLEPFLPERAAEGPGRQRCLLHGLTDSPYSLRSVAALLVEQGFSHARAAHAGTRNPSRRPRRRSL